MSERVDGVRDSVRFLGSSDDWVKTVVVGSLLSLFSVLIVPVILLVGYYVHALRASTRGADAAPGFDDWEALASDGIRGSTIILAYTVAFLVTTSLLAGFLSSAGGDGGAVLAGLAVFAGGTATVYVTPAAVANYAEAETLRAGFDVGGLRATVSTDRYARAWFSAAAVIVVGWIVMAVLSIVPLLGVVAGIAVNFYVTTVVCHLLGRAWRDVRDPETGAGSSETGARQSGTDPTDRSPSFLDDVTGRIHGVGSRIHSVGSRIHGVGSRIHGVGSRLRGVGDAVRALLPTGPSTWPTSGEGDFARRPDDRNDGEASVRDVSTGGRTTDRKTPSVATLAERPTETLDADDVAVLVAGLDAGDPETVAMAARTVGEVAAVRPDLIVDSGATPRLRDLRLADDSRVREAATRAVRRLSDAGIY